MEKAEHERAVFKEFCRVAGLHLAEGSIEQRQPPEPDLFCKLEDRPIYFELGRLLDAEVPKMRIEALRRAPLPTKPRLGRIRLPERDVLQQKVQKRYETSGIGVQLANALHSSVAVSGGTIRTRDMA